MPLSEELRSRLQSLIAADEVVLFMKGNRARPQCGFSASVVQVLDELVPSYRTVDVLADPEVRDGIKELSAWPTIPQLYGRGEFVGGADIVREMHGSGELEGLLGVVRKEIAPPRITVTPRAAAVFREATADAGPDDVIRVSISPRFEHDLGVEAARPGDVKVEVDGLRFVLDRMSAETAAEMAQGARRAYDQILRRQGRAFAQVFAGDAAIGTVLNVQRVAPVNEHEDRLHQVVAVGAPPRNVQEQVELCRGWQVVERLHRVNGREGCAAWPAAGAATVGPRSVPGALRQGRPASLRRQRNARAASQTMPLRADGCR